MRIILAAALLAITSSAHARMAELSVRFCAKIRLNGEPLKVVAKREKRPVPEVNLRTDLILQDGSSVQRGGEPGRSFTLYPTLKIEKNGENCVETKVGEDEDMTAFVSALADAERPSRVAKALNATASFTYDGREYTAQPTGTVWVTNKDFGQDKEYVCRQSGCKIGILAIFNATN